MKINFPKPSDKENDSDMNPLNQLEAFCITFNNIYEGHFYGTITTASELIDNSISIINYAFWIDFLKIKDYSYRLFELNPTKIEGGYPMKATAFHGPPEEYGTINTSTELEITINAILNSERGRFIILSNY